MSLKNETKRRLVHGGNAIVVIVIFVAILVGINFLGTRYKSRLDLTENNLFSISSQSEQVLAGLTQDVQITAFIPESFRSYEESKQAEFIKDILAEYDELSGNISVEYVNPNKEPQKTKEAGIMAAPAVNIVVGEMNDTLYTANINEQSLTSSLVKLTREKETNLGFVVNKAGHEPDTDMTIVKRLLESEGYMVSNVDIAQEEDLAKYNALVISGTKDIYSPTDLYILDKYIYEGGKILFSLDPLFETGLESLLDSYGIEMPNNFVIEEKSYYWDLFRGKFYHWPIISSFTDMQIVRNFKGVLMPLARALFLKNDISPDIVVEEIMKTSENSWIETDTTSESATFTEGEDQRGPVTLGITMIGKFKSYFEGQDLKAMMDNAEKDITAEVEDENPITSEMLERGENLEARVVVYGDSDFMTDSQIRNNNNADLIMNTLNWLVEDEDLITIRPKEAEDRRIDSMSETVQNIIFWGNLLAVPFLVLIFGLIRYLLVRRSRNRL